MRAMSRPVAVKRIAIAVAAVVLNVAVNSAAAEQQEPKRASATPQPPSRLVIRTNELFPLTPPTRVGMFTLAPPNRNGEVIRVAIPVGELVSRTARAVSDANHRRAERKADERVRKDLEQFIADSKRP
jgi:hypothetical protein